MIRCFFFEGGHCNQHTLGKDCSHAFSSILLRVSISKGNFSH